MMLLQNFIQSINCQEQSPLTFCHSTNSIILRPSGLSKVGQIFEVESIQLYNLNVN